MIDNAQVPAELEPLIEWLRGHVGENPAARVADATTHAYLDTSASRNWVRALRALARANLLGPALTAPEHVGGAVDALVLADAHGPLDQDAYLAFDSRRDPALAGVRSASSDDRVIHLAYRSDDSDLFLDVARTAPSRISVHGQVLPDDLDHHVPSPADAEHLAISATASGPGFVSQSADGDELGRFWWSDLPSTVDRLSVRIAGRTTIDVPLAPPRS